MSYNYNNARGSVPVSFPSYINEIPNKISRNAWEARYVQAYKEKYNELSDKWDGLKATISGISILAAGVFGCIMLGTAATLSVPLIVASIITVSSMSLAVSICAMVYFGCKAGETSDNLCNLSGQFPIEFKIEFNEFELKSIRASAPPFDA